MKLVIDFDLWQSLANRRGSMWTLSALLFGMAIVELSGDWLAGRLMLAAQWAAMVWAGRLFGFLNGRFRDRFFREHENVTSESDDEGDETADRSGRSSS